jgi:general stress protein 26
MTALYRTALAVSISGLAAPGLAAPATALSPEMQTALNDGKEIYVATRRANGSRSSAAPVWFWWDGQYVYFTTAPDSHKGKRIRRGSPVYVSVQGKEGPFVEGTAETITDLDLVARLGDEYKDKYWIAWLGLFRPRPERVRAGKTMAVKVSFPE